MAWESDRSVWLCDTQGWQTLVPATTTLERMNLVRAADCVAHCCCPLKQ